MMNSFFVRCMMKIMIFHISCGSVTRYHTVVSINLSNLCMLHITASVISHIFLF